MGSTVIVGAGISGLTCAYLLAKARLPVIILEKENEVGGLARTFRYQHHSFDIGPHRFYSTNPLVLDFLNEILGDDVLSLPRFSGVHFLGKYHVWPLKLKSIFQLPLNVSARALYDIFTKHLSYEPGNPSFENYVLGKYGRTLYLKFFKPYTEKFLGIPAEKVHANWAKIGVERATIDEKCTTASLLLVFKNMLLPVQRDLNFIYPPRGINVFAERLKKQIEDLGGRFHTGVVLTRLHTNDGKISQVDCGNLSIPCERVLWTGSLTDLCRLLGISHRDLSYLSMIVYNTELASPPLYNFQWCYFGAKEIVFSRTSNPAVFSREMCPQGKGGLCIEVTCQEGDSVWQKPEQHFDRIRKELSDTGVLRSSRDVQDIHVERISGAYPIYDINYVEKLAEVKKDLAKYSNLILAGRTSLFWYNNMDHSIENAFEVVRGILGVPLPERESALSLEQIKEETRESLLFPRPT